MSGFNKINHHDHDTHIDFEEKEHKYFIDGSNENIISVTTFMHNFFEPFNPQIMSQRCSKSKSGEYAGKTPEEILKMWDNTREEGSKKHAAIDHYLCGQAGGISLKGKVDNDMPPPKSFFEWYNKYKDWKPYRTEWSIFDYDTRIAGQLDVLFMDGDKYRLVDWKNTKGINTEGYGNKRGKHTLTHDLPDCNYQHYRLQLNIYRHILEKNYGLHISSMHLVNFPPKLVEEGIFEEYELEHLDINPFFAYRLENMQSIRFI